MPELRARVDASVLDALDEHARTSGAPVDHLVERALGRVPRSRAPHALPGVDRGCAGGRRVPGGGVGRRRARARRLRTGHVRGSRRRDDRARRSRVPGRRPTAAVSEVADDRRTPFAVVTRFGDPPPVVIGHIDAFGALTGALDGLRQSANVFFAVRVDGRFDAVHVRAACRTTPGVPLAIATERRRSSSSAAVRGTMVGFWSPPYASGRRDRGLPPALPQRRPNRGRSRARLSRRGSDGAPPGGVPTCTWRSPTPPRSATPT